MVLGVHPLPSPSEPWLRPHLLAPRLPTFAQSPHDRYHLRYWLPHRRNATLAIALTANGVCNQTAIVCGSATWLSATQATCSINAALALRGCSVSATITRRGYSSTAATQFSVIDPVFTTFNASFLFEGDTAPVAGPCFQCLATNYSQFSHS